MAELTKKDTKVLNLSGTPFNLLDNYNENEIYTWNYVMEQRAKAQWDIDHPGDHNPYAGLPRLNIYTYDLGRLMGEYADEDIAFNFREFFRTKEDGSFVHERHVENFLNLLIKTDGTKEAPKKKLGFQLRKTNFSNKSLILQLPVESTARYAPAS